jgi:two-component system, sensor histidine kinase and response regulator
VNNLNLDVKPEIKILLVDDREDNLFSIQAVLEQDGYRIYKANSGHQALKVLLKETDFTLILMDVEMPILNGFETAALIYEREKLRQIPIIFITANNYSDDYVFKGYKTGGVDYIYKPINPDLLRAKVSVFVELYRKNQKLIVHEQNLKMINAELEERVKERTDELVRKNIELETMNAELKKVNNDLDNFVYTASHDLKAPVSNIEGLMNALNDCINDPNSHTQDVAVLLEMIGKSINRFKGTIQDLTEITKIQKNLDDEVEVIDIKEILDDIKLSIQELIIKNSAEIKVDFSDCSQIKFSKKNFKSILFNLLSNAIKYRDPERKPKILIKTKVEGNYVLLSIKDNGLGMDLKADSKIFTMFKRLHDHVEGSGIGLYIVKRIVNNAGGKIEVESKVGQGSEFKIYFNKSLCAPKILTGQQ